MKTIKVIALGNLLMKDDAIALEVSKKLKPFLDSVNIPLITAETDVNYALSSINESDFLFIIDAAFIDIPIGEIYCYSLSSLHTKNDCFLFTHDESLLYMLPLYFKNIDGFFIAISVENVSFEVGISEKLEKNIDKIVVKIKEAIKTVIA